MIVSIDRIESNIRNELHKKLTNITYLYLVNIGTEISTYMR
jgi:hypothetical protein